MNKRKLPISLVSGVICLLTATACSSGVTGDDKNIVTFKGYDGEEIAVLTNTVYNEYRKQSDGISKFYNAILSTVVRYQFEKGGLPSSVKTLETIRNEADLEVKNAKGDADENHNTNGTSYETEWQNILNKYGVEDEAQLKEYFVLQIEKQELNDLYFKDRKLNLINEFIGINKDGTLPSNTVKGTYPYHIRHVLSKVTGSNGKFYNGEITKDEALHLYNTAKALITKKYSFSDVALEFSEDNTDKNTSSAFKGGDLGIMSTNTSFVNEFKLGLYAVDAVLNRDDANNSDVVLKGLGLKENVSYYKAGASEKSQGTAQAYFKTLELEKVPYGAFKLLGSYADVELGEGNKKVNNGNSQYYPRNVIWNNYLNKHVPFVITKCDLIPDDTNVLVPTYDATLEPTRFTEDSADGLLTDEKGNVIYGVCSEHGIHFMTIQKSIYDFNVTGGENSEETNLVEYFTTYVPGDYDPQDYSKSYPYFMKDGERVDKETYVNFIKSTDTSKYDKRATEVKDALKSFDANYDYRLFQLYENNDAFTYNNTDGLDLKEIIDNYINSSITNSQFTAYKSLKDSWQTYIELIETQNANRISVTNEDAGDGKAENEFRLIPSRCITGFKDKKFKNSGSADPAWSDGGMCHYED